MVRIILILVCVSFSFQGLSANERTPEEILGRKEAVVPYYRLHTNLMDAMVINMPFGDATISSADRAAIKNAVVVRIDLVYTDYPKGSDLTDLNARRIKVIQSLRKDLVTDNSIMWRVFRQNGCKNEAEAKVLFHGVVIHYRPEQSEEVTAADLSYLDAYLPVEDSVESFPGLVKNMKDTTIIAVLNRKKKWKKMHVIADLTGSMSPYVAQLAIWFHLNMESERLRHVTFFNDGDQKSAYQKPIGSTGGIYHGKATSYGQLRRTMIKTIKNGNGGDSPENDIEAVLAAMQQNPDASEYVLIADNLAPIKDYILTIKIDKPVRVVLCGAQYGINLQYLNLARQTGGSVHTIEQDIENLAAKKENELFVIGRHVYKIENDKVVKYR